MALQCAPADDRAIFDAPISPLYPLFPMESPVFKKSSGRKKGYMKSIKMLGLATMAVLASMAYVGTGLASAESTQFCSVATSPCPAGNVITQVHYLDPLVILETSVLTVHCHLLALGTTLGLGNPLILHGSFTASSCTNACTMTQVSSSSLLEVLREGLSGKATFTFEINVHCGELINCTYNGKGLVGTVVAPSLPGTAGKIVVSKKVIEKTGGLFCPKTGTLSTSLESLTDTFLTA